MAFVPRIVLACGILLMAGGVTGAGLTYRDMSLQSVLHARQGSVVFAPGSSPDSTASLFSVYRPGDYLLLLVPGPEVRSGSPFSVAVLTPDGSVAMDRRYPGAPPGGRTSTAQGEWIVDTLHVERALDGAWRITVRFPRGAPPGRELALLPPQEYDVAAHVYRSTFQLVGMGFLMLAGFGLTLLGGMLEKKRRRTG